VRAHVTKDNSVRTIELELEGLPDLDVTQRWQRNTRKIRPDRASIQIRNGEVRSISVGGPLVKKSGQPSEGVRDTAHYRMTEAYIERERIENAPGWVQELVAQVPLGITTFTWVSPEEAQVL